jgi:hypothetical protein
MEAIVSTNETNNYTTSELIYLSESIENMTKFNQIEILRICNNHSSVILNENKSGVRITISELKQTIIDELFMYVKYVNNQETTLRTVEQEKTDYKNTYFTKDIKAIAQK